MLVYDVQELRLAIKGGMPIEREELPYDAWLLMGAIDRRESQSIAGMFGG